MFYNYGLPLLFESPFDVDLAYQDCITFKLLSWACLTKHTVGFGGPFNRLSFFFSSSLPPFSFYSELLLALLSRPIGIGSCKRYMLGDFSIKAQNKPIIQSFNCKIFYDSATVHFYI